MRGFLKSAGLFIGALAVAAGVTAFIAWRYGTGEAAPLDLSPFDPNTFEPTRVVQAFPAIEEFPVRTVADAARDFHPEELVLAVEVGGEARAYPINTLTGPDREILNDELGGRALAATW